MAQLACYQYSIISVPLYDTLGADAIEYIVNQTEMEFCLTTSNKAQDLLNMKDRLPNLKTIIISDQYDQELTDLANSLKIKIVNFIVVEKDGSVHPAKAENPSPNDTAFICYTSGTTGIPKGVVLSHKNIMASVASTRWLAGKGKLFKATPDDV